MREFSYTDKNLNVLFVRKFNRFKSLLLTKSDKRDEQRASMFDDR